MNDIEDLYSNYIYSKKKKYGYSIEHQQSDEEKLDDIDIRVIESYIRKKKLKNLNKK